MSGKTMRLVAMGIAVAFVAAAAIAAEEQSPERYKNVSRGFSIAIPSGWSATDNRPAGTDLVAISSSDKASSTYDASMTLGIERLAAGTTLDQYMESGTTTMQKAMTGFTLLDSGDMKVDNVAAKYFTYSAQSQGGDLKGVCVVLVKGTTGVFMYFSTKQALYGSYEKVFETTAESFRFEKLNTQNRAKP
jgi:hypothetical protein